MKKNDLLLSKLKEVPEDNEIFVSSFLGTYQASILWALLLSPIIWAFMTTNYRIVVSDKSLYFIKLGMLSNVNFKEITRYSRSEVKLINSKKALLPMYKLHFQFNNEKTLKLKPIQRRRPVINVGR